MYFSFFSLQEDVFLVCFCFLSFPLYLPSTVCKGHRSSTACIRVQSRSCFECVQLLSIHIFFVPWWHGSAFLNEFCRPQKSPARRYNIGRAEHLSLHLLGLSTLSQGTFLPVPTCIFASVLEQMSEDIVAILPEELQLSAHHCSTSRISTSAWLLPSTALTQTHYCPTSGISTSAWFRHCLV